MSAATRPGVPADPTGSPRVAHSPASLTALAVAMTAEVGLDSLTIREVARRAGAYPAVIYHHIGDLEAVRYAVSDAIVAAIEIPPLPLARPASAWRPWLTVVAENAYGVLSRHQGVFPYIARIGPSSPSQIDMIDACMQVLTSAGLDDRSAALAYGTFVHYVGSVADLAAASALLNDDAERRGEFERRLRNVAGIHPGLQRALPTFLDWNDDDAFRAGLELLLDGVEQRCRRSRRQQSRPKRGDS